MSLPIEDFVCGIKGKLKAYLFITIFRFPKEFISIFRNLNSIFFGLSDLSQINTIKCTLVVYLITIEKA